MKVCVLTQHPLDDIRVFRRHVRSLLEHGHQVVFFARPAVGPEPAHPGLTARAVRVQGGWRLWRLFKESLVLLRLGLSVADADLYHFHNPMLLLTGLILQRRTGRPVVYDLHEDYPNQVRMKYWIWAPLREPAARFFELLQAAAVKRFSAVVVADHNLGQIFRPHARDLEVVFNFPRLESFPPASPRDQADRPGQRRLVMVGGIARERGSSDAVEALAILGERRPGLTLDIVGHGHDEAYLAELRGLIERRGLAGRVNLTGLVPHERVIELLGQADIGLCPLRDVPKFRVNLPQKIFEYMACSLPVVGSDLPTIAPFLKGQGDGQAAGLCHHPGDPASLAQALEQLLAEPRQAAAMGREGRRRVEREYNWEAMEERLLGLYARLTGTSA